MAQAEVLHDSRGTAADVLVIVVTLAPVQVSEQSAGPTSVKQEAKLIQTLCLCRCMYS